MTSYVLVDDSDTSFFTYTGSTWTADHTGDAAVPMYRNQTFYSSTTNNDFVMFQYTGSDFQAWGGLRYNHGIYAIQVDGGLIQYYSGMASPDIVPGMLYGSSGLSKGDHSVTIWNKNANLAIAGRIWFDLDFVVYNPDDTEVQPTATTQDLSTLSTFPAASLAWTVPGIQSVDPSYTFASFTGRPSPSTFAPSQAGQISSSPTSGPIPTSNTISTVTTASTSQTSSSVRYMPGPGSATSSTESGLDAANKILTIVIPSGVVALLLVALGAALFVWVRRRREGRMRRLESSEDTETIPSRFYRGTGWTRSIQTIGASTARF